jgi:uncharacterized integral membrane protein
VGRHHRLRRRADRAAGLIVQNSNPVEIYFLVWVTTLPADVALLAAPVAGILVVAVPGASRHIRHDLTARNPAAAI